MNPVDILGGLGLRSLWRGGGRGKKSAGNRVDGLINTALVVIKFV